MRTEKLDIGLWVSLILLVFAVILMVLIVRDKLPIS
jgi:uncharacterized membrane protein YidH (DUF202 family)